MALCDILYKRLRNTLIYLLAYMYLAGLWVASGRWRCSSNNRRADVVAAILKIWCDIKKTPSVHAYLLEQSCRLLSQSDLKWQTLEDRYPKQKNNNNNMSSNMGPVPDPRTVAVVVAVVVSCCITENKFTWKVSASFCSSCIRARSLT